MEKIKKFLLYLVMFIGLFLIVNGLTYLCMRENYRNINNYKIAITSPKIIVNESKATDYHGYIKGKISNDTGKHIRDKYLQFDFYDYDKVYLGTESKEIKYFNVNEIINFEINYQYLNVDSIEINFVDEVVIPTEESLDLFENINDSTLKIAIPIAAILGLYVILP